MEKYINAERLKDSMLAYYDCLSESANGRPYKGDTLMDYEVVDMIEDCIDNAPTADVAEVVRCKDCKYFREYSNVHKRAVERADGDCFFKQIRSYDEQFIACRYNDFCSSGRKEIKERF